MKIVKWKFSEAESFKINYILFSRSYLTEKLLKLPEKIHIVEWETELSSMSSTQLKEISHFDAAKVSKKRAAEKNVPEFLGQRDRSLSPQLDPSHSLLTMTNNRINLEHHATFVA